MRRVEELRERIMPEPLDRRVRESDADLLGSVSVLLRDLRKGDQRAGLALWDRYLPRLTGLARRTLGTHRPGIADPDDAVQSAWISFWQRLDDGRLSQDLSRDDFWNLLGLIVVRKSRKQVRRELAEKRGGGQVRRESELAADSGGGPLDAAPAMPDARDLDLFGEELLQQLNEECRRIAVLRLMGHSTGEIAAEFGCTERKIQRKLELIRLEWSAAVEPD
jgi:DNA-directed RNA polymerase specialized sigma24 family protein